MIYVNEALGLVERLKSELESLNDATEHRPTPVDDLGALVKNTRKKQRLTQVELADLAGIGTATLKRIESGSKDVTFNNLMSVLDALGIRLWVG